MAAIVVQTTQLLSLRRVCCLLSEVLNLGKFYMRIILRDSYNQNLHSPAGRVVRRFALARRIFYPPLAIGQWIWPSLLTVSLCQVLCPTPQTATISLFLFCKTVSSSLPPTDKQQQGNQTQTQKIRAKHALPRSRNVTTYMVGKGSHTLLLGTRRTLKKKKKKLRHLHSSNRTRIS